jgi:hypothetical protein
MRKHTIIRIVILILVTIIFIGSFYFFFKNSRASSPLRDKEYMQRLETLSNRYQVAGGISPTPISIADSDLNEPTFIESLGNFFLKLFNK